MHNFLRFFVIAVMFFVCTPSVRAEDFNGNITGTEFYLAEDSYIAPNVHFDIKNLYIISSLSLINRGFIAGDIFIDDNRRLYLQNSGDILGTVNIGVGGALTQIVRRSEDLNFLNIVRGASASFVVRADGATGVNFMDLAAIAVSADRLVLRNSVIDFTIGDRADVPVEISGEVIFRISCKATDGGELVPDALGDGILTVKAANSKLFYIDSMRDGDDWILTSRRKTDYTEIIGGRTGQFINTVRSAGTNARVLSRMDAAQSESELYGIMANSVMLNPVKLMNPIKTMTTFLDANGAPTPLHGGGGALAIFGGDMTVLRADAGVGGSANNFTFSAYGHFGELSVGGMESFSGYFYGGNITAAMNSKWLFAHATAGASFADFDAGPIYNGTGDAEYNPSGMAYYGAVTIGINAYSIGDARRSEFYVMPIARARMFSAKVLHDTESEFAIGGGARAGFRAQTLGIKTDYSAYGLLEPGGGQFGLRGEVTMPRDGVGVMLDAAALEIDNVWFYKIGAGVKVNF
ncbi:MAG: hypothetical protein FWF34_01405 [Alphaproteobacteria bacterium]|nr:hypothetical protein [Alphaproteobacteria bacterium]MCL2889897.1 hypothetical protein [Alphaproteobacteria bacterium]